MNSQTPNPARRRSGLRAALARGAFALLALGAGLSWQTAIAAAPPAATQISNQASANYTDSTGAAQTALSNTVITTIQQVGSFTLVPSSTTPTAASSNGNSASVVSGGTASVPYTITNTGNGTDTFNISLTGMTAGLSGTLYADVDQNGLPDNSTAITSATVAAGAKFSFVVVYTVPVAAAGTAYNGTITVAPAGAVTYGYPVPSMVRTDTITITATASFAATKAIEAPSAGIGGAWPVVTSGARGTTTTYTIRYVNNGGDLGNIYIKDVLGTGATAGLAYVPGSAYWSNAPATALTDAAGSETAANIEYQYTAGTQTIEAVVKNVPAGASGTISFQVQVTTGVAPGTTVAALGTSTTTNAALFTPNSCTTGTAAITDCSGASTLSTSGAAFTVTGSYGVRAGPLQDVTPGIAVSGDDATTFPAGASAKVVAGSSLRFKFTIYNTSTTDQDVFKLSATATGNSTTLSYNWFAANGTTPLQNTTGSAGGIPDTGPILANGSVDVVLLVNVPAGTVATATDILVTALATSFNDSTKKDAALATITDVVPAVVDLEDANGAAMLGTGPGTNSILRTISLTAGGPGVSTAAAPSATAGSAVFDLVVTNNDTGALTFNLSTAQTATFPGSLPAGWTVSFHSSLVNATSGASPITDTGSILSGASTHVYARVTPPASYTGGTANLFFRAQSTASSEITGAVVTDFLGDAISVSVVGTLSFSVSPAGALQVAPGSSAAYAHTVANTGSQSCGATTASVAALPSGWTATLYTDSGTIGTLDAADTVLGSGASLTNVSLSASPLDFGVQFKLLLVVSAPPYALVGEVATATMTVTTANCIPAVTVADVTTVVAAGQITVVKYQSLSAASSGVCAATVTPTSTLAITGAKPGDCVAYRVVATNISTAIVNNVAINDAVPGFTSYYGTQPATQCAGVGTSGALSLTTTLPTLKCGTATTLNPGGTLTLDYVVQINQ